MVKGPPQRKLILIHERSKYPNVKPAIYDYVEAIYERDPATLGSPANSVLALLNAMDFDVVFGNNDHVEAYSVTNLTFPRIKFRMGLLPDDKKWKRQREALQTWFRPEDQYLMENNVPIGGTKQFKYAEGQLYIASDLALCASKFGIDLHPFSVDIAFGCTPALSYPIYIAWNRHMSTAYKGTPLASAATNLAADLSAWTTAMTTSIQVLGDDAIQYDACGPIAAYFSDRGLRELIDVMLVHLLLCALSDPGIKRYPFQLDAQRPLTSDPVFDWSLAMAASMHSEWFMTIMHLAADFWTYNIKDKASVALTFDAAARRFEFAKAETRVRLRMDQRARRNDPRTVDRERNFILKWSDDYCTFVRRRDALFAAVDERLRACLVPLHKLAAQDMTVNNAVPPPMGPVPSSRRKKSGRASHQENAVSAENLFKAPQEDHYGEQPLLSQVHTAMADGLGMDVFDLGPPPEDLVAIDALPTNDLVLVFNYIRMNGLSRCSLPHRRAISDKFDALLQMPEFQLLSRIYNWATPGVDWDAFYTPHAGSH